MIKFNPFREQHIPLFRFWLHQDHVKKFWQEPEDEAELKEKFLVRLSAQSVQSFIIVKDNIEIGYIQYYNAKKVGGNWWTEEAPGTFGIDVVIGSLGHVGTGLGPAIIKEFLTFLCKKEKNVKSIIIDPAPDNTKAIRAFEKAGFRKESEIKTPGGKALLMRTEPPVVEANKQ